MRKRSSRITRRRLLIESTVIVGGLALGAAVSGCTPTPTTATAPKEAETPKVEATQVPVRSDSPITLRVQVRAGESGAYQYELFDRYVAQNPHIKIEAEEVPHTEISMKTELGWVAGDLPDILRAHTRWFHLGCYNGWYLALDDLLDSTDAVPDYDDFSPVAVENMKFEGKTYALPESAWTSVSQLIIWNRSLIEEAGAEPPTPDMDMWDLFELARKCANPDKGVFGIEMRLVTVARLTTTMRAWGKPEYGPTGDTTTWLASADGKRFQFLENAGAQELLKNWLAPLLKERVHPTSADQISGVTLFDAGKCAMMQGSVSNPGRSKIGIGDNWDFHTQDCITLPKGPDGRIGTAQEGDSESIYSKTKYPDEALRLSGYLTSYEGGMYATEAQGYWTGRYSVFKDPKWASDFPIFSEVADTLWDAGIVEPYPMPWNLRDPEVTDVYNNLITPLLQGAKTWEEQAPLIQNECQKVYDLPRP